MTAAVLFIRMQLMLASLSPNILALQFAFTPASFQGVLADWQGHGVAAYRAHFPLDFAFLLSYGVFGYLLASRPQAEHAKWLAPAAAACDAAENVAHLFLLSSAAAPSGWVVAVAATLSLLKWLLLAVFAAAVYPVAARILKSLMRGRSL